MSLESHSHPPEQGSREVIDSEVLLHAQSQEVRDIIEKDPILKGNLDKISNLREFFIALEANKSIFLQTDNTQAQRDFLVSSIKGLGYGQMTKDGREFGKLTEEKVKRLERREKEGYYEWKNAQLDATVIKEDENNVRKQATVIKEDENNVRKQATVIEKQEKGKELDATLIRFQEQEKEAKGIINEINKNLSSEGNSLIEKKFLEAKSDTNNPIALDLKSKGIDPNTGSYDNLLRASIILSNQEILVNFATDKAKFTNSIRALDTIDIPRAISLQIKDIQSHIDARFPKSASTEAAKAEIARSIGTGGVSSIYYDGKGEKYTLIDKDGKTSKEVYMNPPQVHITQSSLSISREAPRIDISVKELADLKGERTRGEQEAIRIMSALYRPIDHAHIPDAMKQKDQGSVLTLHRSAQIQFGETSDIPTRLKAIGDLRRENYAIEKLWKQSITTDNADDKAMEDMERSIYQERHGLTILETNLLRLSAVDERISALEKEKNGIDTFDSTARANLSWLTSDTELFHRMGSRANEALYRMIDAVNRTRDPSNQIRVSEKPIDASDRDTLRTLYNTLMKNLGYDRSILTRADIGDFQKKISEALTKRGRDTLGSIENLIRPKSEPS